MDRAIVYPGAIPLETDILKAQKNSFIAVAKLAEAIFGSGSTLLTGLICTPTAPASLDVQVSPGQIYAMVAADGTPYGSLAADSHSILKQGLLLDTVTLNCPAPATAGFSINYLIQAGYSDVDANSVVLPYYNASNPSLAYSGPANAGTAQNTIRKGVCTVTAKAGIAAATGAQQTPAPDAGYVGAWVVTVANGQATITAPNIVKATNAPFIADVELALNVQKLAGKSATDFSLITHRHNGVDASLNYAADTGSVNAYVINLTPALTAHVVGMLICFKAANANTGASTVTFNALAAAALKRPDGTPLEAGDIPAGAFVAALWDGTVYRAITVGVVDGESYGGRAFGKGNIYTVYTAKETTWLAANVKYDTDGSMRYLSDGYAHYIKMTKYATGAKFAVAPSGLAGAVIVWGAEQDVINPPGSVIGFTHTYSPITAQTINTVVPQDDTVPTTTEMTAIATRDYTAKKVGNHLKIEYDASGVGDSTGGSWILGVFIDGATEAAKVMWGMSSDAWMAKYRFKAIITVADTNSHTYTIRMGVASGSLTLNSIGGVPAHVFGAASGGLMTIEEIAGA